MSEIQSSSARVVALPSPATVPLASVQGALALDLTPRVEPPRPRLRSATACDLVVADRIARQRLDLFVRRFLQAVVEIATADRPVSQVLRHCVPEVYADLTTRARVVADASGTARASGRGPGAVRPVVVGVRTALVRDDAIEASAHVRYGQRSPAVAARMELIRDRWQCVALELG